MKSKEKKVVVITGASSGIGLSLYNLYLKNGDIPISLSRTNNENLQNFIQCDVSKESDVENAFLKISQNYGKIDILINNAGFGISGAIELEDSKNVENIFNVNFMGAYFCYKYAVPLIKKGGKILNISSVCALFPVPFRGFYSSSKSALSLLSFTEYMELKSTKIGVCTICPGETKSNFNKNRIRNLKTNERYLDRIESTTTKLKNSDSKRMDTNYVANKIMKISFKKNTKPLKIIGFKYKILYFLQRIFPTKWFLEVTNKILGK